MARAVSTDIVVLGSRRKAKLEAIVRRPSSPQALVRRARIVLLAHQRWPNAQIAAALGCSVTTVRTWRRRFARGGIPALPDRPRSGRPEVYGPDVRLRIVAAATSVPPEATSVWTHALIAGQLADTGISASQAGRVLAGLELAPHRVRGWLNRRDDEQFWAQAAAVCDAYLHPPPGTVVICIDEKTGIQAKCRKYPERPPAPGRPARREFEYVRHGTVSIVAALQVATGQVVAEPIGRNDSATFTSFLHRLDQCTDPRLNIHLIMDNGSSHTSRATRAWIAAHPRITVTYTPKHASWLDMAELWFISTPDLGVFAVAAAGVLCAFCCVVDTLPEECLRRRPVQIPFSLPFLELSGYYVNAVQLHLHAADVLVRCGIHREGFR